MNKTSWKNLIKILLVIYGLFVIWIVLFKASFSLDELLGLYSNTKRINIIPFYYDNENSTHLPEIISNIQIFIPLGLYLRMLNWSNKKTILFGALVSLGFEIMQYIFSIGILDITDFITNTFGTIVGVGLYALLLFIFKNKVKMDKVLSILALICTIIIISLSVVLFMFNY